MNSSSKFKLNLPLFLITLFVFIQGLSSCQTQQKKLQKAGLASTLITYTKERGRGMKKPVYTFEIMSSKVMKYTGVANVSVIGERIIDLDAKAYDALLANFVASDFKEFESVYKGRMRDLPLTSITFEEHKVTFQEEACPDKLEKLAQQIESLIVLAELK